MVMRFLLQKQEVNTHDVVLGIHDLTILDKPLLNTIRYIFHLKLQVRGGTIPVPKRILFWSLSQIPNSFRERVFNTLKELYNDHNIGFTEEMVSFMEFNEVDPTVLEQIEEVVKRADHNFYIIPQFEEGHIHDIRDVYETFYKRSMVNVTFLTFNDNGFSLSYIHSPFGLYQN